MSFSDGDCTSPLTLHSALLFYQLTICKGPLGFDVDKNAAISIAISALTMMEGRLDLSVAMWKALTPEFHSCPLCSIWRNVRGAGLAYGASMDHDVFSGLLKLDIYRSSQPAAGTASFF